MLLSPHTNDRMLLKGGEKIMRLNPSCVRYVLTYIEENVGYGAFLFANDIPLDIFNKNDIIYTADKLAEANFINAEVSRNMGGNPNILINSLTWSGHEFLDNIRDDNVWKNTKNIISKFSSVSLTLVSNIASQVISAMIKNQLNI